MMSKLINFRNFCVNSTISTPFVKLIEQGTCGMIVLNRPKEINAITSEMSQ